MTESQQLLAEYVRNGSENAFQELVARYVDLVYSTALRLVEGDAHRARDVAQTVFVDLARMASKLSPNSMLGGWLHRRACFVARTLMRGERRRQARERQAVEMSALENQPDAALAEIAPVLDEAINELGADDRDAILLRFFEQRSLRSVGDALGTTENVAQKRVARAVQELAVLLKQRGFTLPAAALASGLAAGAVKAAPAGLALALAKGALSVSGTSAGITATSAKTLALTKVKAGIAGALIVAGIATTLWLRHLTTRQQPGEKPAAVSQVEEQPVGTPEFLPAPGPGSQPLGVEQTSVVQQSRAEPGVVPSELSDAVSVAATQAGAAPLRPIPGAALVQRLYSQAGSRVRIEGTNNATRQPWQAESTAIEGFWDYYMGPAAETGTNREQIPARAEVIVPIRSIKTVDQQGRPYSDSIDAAWYAAFRARANPDAKAAFYLSVLRRVEPTAKTGSVQTLEAKGDLVMVGVSNSITFPVRILPLEGERLKISGSTSIGWISDEVDPFSVRTEAGLFSPASRVTVRFEWLVGPTNTPNTAAQEGLVPLYLELPAPRFKQPPRDMQISSYVEPFPEMPRAPMLVPPGLTNLARNAEVTSSDRNVAPQVLAKIVDGNKDGTDESIVYLRKGTEWVQLDLGIPHEIFAVALWHAHNMAKIYHDVIVQIADDPQFQRNVRTLFNNDQDNSSGLGKGADWEYFETWEGKLINARGVQGRYLRFYSKGSTESAPNEYTEIEVYGRPGQ